MTAHDSGLRLPGTIPLAASTSYRQINEDILRTLDTPAPAYFASLGLLLAVLGFGVYAFTQQWQTGLGVAGYEHPIAWSIYITNFVFWVGIAHSGTLISAVLYLFRAKWRTSVARAAEAMTVFAVMTAGLFPIIHIGRPWFFYWLIPYPNERQLWVNFRSPLIWDLFAIVTYLTVSVMFLYLGLIPDNAAARDRCTDWRKPVYRVLALGWRGSTRQWMHYAALYGLFAALATPLVVSVHSVVSWDFAVSILPGWHSTIFAPYFVAGAIFSGLAMVITLLIPLRKLLRLEKYITIRHFENLAKLIIVTSLIVGYAYVTEFFIAWYSGSTFEQGTFFDRAFGQYWPFTWLMIVCNVFVPLLLFWKKVRTNLAWLFGISILVNIGMWLERFVIIVASLSHDFDPANWTGIYQPTWVEGAITAGSFGLFFLLFLLFVKNFPAVSVTDMKEGSAHAEMVDDSLARCLTGHGFLDRFYELFLGSSDEVAPTFTDTDVAGQKKMLEDSLSLMTSVSKAPREELDDLDRVAHRHGRDDLVIRPELYDLWRESLLQTVREFDAHFDWDIERAWRNVLADGVECTQSQR